MSTMVDSKLAKSVQKSVGRAKEKILQNLGKVDRTADEIFDEHVANFNKQQCASTRLQKELNNYIRCIRACAGASRALLEAVGDVYEPEWGGKELVTVNSQTSEMLWNDFAHRLAEQVLIPLNTYQAQFPEMRKKIEKRGRKLVDYDGERHALQALQSNPRRAEAKLARQRESLEAAKRTYEVLNSELHEELPSLYGSRIVFLVSAMSTLFASENIFHSEASKVFAELEGIVERLSKESAKGALNHAKAPSNAIINNTDSPKDGKSKSQASATSTTTSSCSSSQAPSNGINSARNKINSAEITPTATTNTTNNADTTCTTNKQSGTTVSDSKTIDADAAWNKMSNGNNGEAAEHLYANISNGGGAGVPPEGEHTSSEETGKTSSDKTQPQANEEHKVNGDDRKDSATATTTPTASTEDKNKTKDEKKPIENGTVNGNNDVESSPSTPLPPPPASVPAAMNEAPPPSSPTDGPKTNGPSHGSNGLTTTDSNANPSNTTAKTNNNTNNSSSTTPTDPAAKLPPGVLYRVRATYRYQKEDVDELSFEAGEIISVVEYDDPEEQEEGWLMGVKENGEKGMFPANFTRPL